MTEGPLYQPEPRFVRLTDNRGDVLVFVEHVEFYFRDGPQERVWAKSLVGKFSKDQLAQDKGILNRFVTLESKRRGYI